MSRNNQTDRVVDIRGIVRGETERAFRFQPDELPAGSQSTSAHWLPKSLCEWYPEDATMVMPEWLAMEKGLI